MLPKADSISNDMILNYPNVDGVANLQQILAGTDQKLSQSAATATAANIGSICDNIMTILNKQPLNTLDKSLALKAFVDRSRGSAEWFLGMQNQCLVGRQSVKTILERIFGNGSIEFKFSDAPVMELGNNYQDWLKYSVPLLDGLKNAFTSDGDRQFVFQRLAGNSVLQVTTTSKAASRWPMASAIGPEGPASQPSAAAISTLTAKKIVAAGCFAYLPQTAENVMTDIGRLLLLDGDGNIWEADVGARQSSTSQALQLTSVDISPLNENTKNYYQRLMSSGFYGSLPASGDCGKIAAIIMADKI